MKKGKRYPVEYRQSESEADETMEQKLNPGFSLCIFVAGFLNFSSAQSLVSCAGIYLISVGYSVTVIQMAPAILFITLFFFFF